MDISQPRPEGRGTTMNEQKAPGNEARPDARRSDIARGSPLGASLSRSRHGVVPRRPFARRCRGWLLTCGAVAIGWPAAAAEPKDGQTKVEKPATGDPLVFLVVPRPEPLIDRLTDSRFLSYLNLSTRYQAFQKSKRATELRAVLKLVATQLGSTWDQALCDLTGGGIVASIEADAGQPPRISLVVVARKPDVLDRASQVFLNLARQDASSKGKPDPVKTSEHGGAQVHFLGAGGPSGIAYAIKDGKLLVSNSIENVECLIDRTVSPEKSGGDSPDQAHGVLAALGDRQEWKAARDRQGLDMMAWGFANLARLRQLDPARTRHRSGPIPG